MVDKKVIDERYTLSEPHGSKIPHANRINFDQETEDKAAILRLQRQTLGTERANTWSNLDRLERGLGEKVLDGADLHQLSTELLTLRGEIECLDAALKLVDNRFEVLKRGAGWLQW